MNEVRIDHAWVEEQLKYFPPGSMDEAVRLIRAYERADLSARPARGVSQRKYGPDLVAPCAEREDPDPHTKYKRDMAAWVARQLENCSPRRVTFGPCHRLVRV